MTKNTRIRQSLLVRRHFQKKKNQVVHPQQWRGGQGRRIVSSDSPGLHSRNVSTNNKHKSPTECLPCMHEALSLIPIAL